MQLGKYSLGQGAADAGHTCQVVYACRLNSL
jgi:hypothetical protein